MAAIENIIRHKGRFMSKLIGNRGSAIDWLDQNKFQEGLTQTIHCEEMVCGLANFTIQSSD